MLFLVQNNTIIPEQFNLLILVLGMGSAPNEPKIGNGLIADHLIYLCFTWLFDSFTKQVDRVLNRIVLLSGLLLMQSLFSIAQK